jgi:hypothetical protein
MGKKSSETDMFKQIFHRKHHRSHGQSFVELMLVVMFLVLLLAGVTEYGFMLNQFLHVLDGSREAARFSSTSLAFVMSGGSIVTDGSGNIEDNLPFYYITAAKAATTMDPVQLNPVNPDDIVISVFSVDSVHLLTQLPTRFPASNPNGWSLCAHYAAFAAYFPTQSASVPTQLSAPGWSLGCTVRTSQFSPADIRTHMSSFTSAPNTGVLLVEIYYNYPQLLKLLSHNAFLGMSYSLLPDPIPLYVYSIMPLSNAQPTQVP